MLKGTVLILKGICKLNQLEDLLILLALVISTRYVTIVIYLFMLLFLLEGYLLLTSGLSSDLSVYFYYHE